MEKNITWAPRKKTKRFKSFEYPFRTDNYISHLVRNYDNLARKDIPPTRPADLFKLSGREFSMTN